jgi:hypothetical protein
VAGPLVPAQMEAGTKGSRPKARFLLVYGNNGECIILAPNLQLAWYIKKIENYILKLKKSEFFMWILTYVPYIF